MGFSRNDCMGLLGVVVGNWVGNDDHAQELG